MTVVGTLLLGRVDLGPIGGSTTTPFKGEAADGSNRLQIVLEDCAARLELYDASLFFDVCYSELTLLLGRWRLGQNYGDS